MGVFTIVCICQFIWVDINVEVIAEKHEFLKDIIHVRSVFGKKNKVVTPSQVRDVCCFSVETSNHVV